MITETLHSECHKSKAVGSLFPSELTARLERTQSTAQQNKEPSQTTYKQWEQQ